MPHDTMPYISHASNEMRHLGREPDIWLGRGLPPGSNSAPTPRSSVGSTIE
jgi:hypothetical protein